MSMTEDYCLLECDMLSVRSLLMFWTPPQKSSSIPQNVFKICTRACSLGCNSRRRKGGQDLTYNPSLGLAPLPSVCLLILCSAVLLLSCTTMAMIYQDAQCKIAEQ
jgi:hypothetical protein